MKQSDSGRQSELRLEALDNRTWAALPDPARREVLDLLRALFRGVFGRHIEGMRNER
jgi:hypothetical protein